MRGEIYTVRYIDWLREFELTDPEPPLDDSVRDRFEHYDNKGRNRGPGWHWRDDLVAAHVAWHRRMTDAYSQVKNELE